MSDYFRRLSKDQVLPPIQTQYDKGGKYHKVLSRSPGEILAVALSTPEVEGIISKQLAARYNKNFDKFDATMDQVYNQTKIGGSALHHNLDGSHTFSGAFDVLKRAYPGETDFHLRLQSVEHLARDFTTPSGINPFLSPTSFTQAKLFLQDQIGLSKSLTNDLINLNAAEMAAGLFGPGLLLFQGDLYDEKSAHVAARQLGRLSVTYFFAGNPIGLMCACAVFIQGILSDHADSNIKAYAAGIGELVLAATLFPSLPLAVSFIIGTAASAWWHTFINVDLAAELDQVFRVQFPAYRSYLGRI